MSAEDTKTTELTEEEVKAAKQALRIKYLTGKLTVEEFDKEMEKLPPDTPAEKRFANILTILSLVFLFAGCYAYMHAMQNPRSFSPEEKIRYYSKDNCLMYKIGCK